MDPWVRVLVTFFLGGFGVHKFADRKIGMGILYLLTGGIFGIGWLVDTIKAIIYAINDGNTETSNTHYSQTPHAEVCNASAAATPQADCRFHPCETDFVDGASRQYRYEFNFAPNNESSANILWALTGASRYTSHELAPQLNGNEVQLYFNGSLVGATTFKLDMFEDWMNRGDPLKIYLLEADRDTGVFRAAVDFYQDRRKKHSWREQSTVALTSFKSQAKQETISLIAEGQELELDDSVDNDKPIPVTYRGDPIGNLPANISHKARDEGISLIVFERSECVGENEDGDDVEQPLIRIYW